MSRIHSVIGGKVLMPTSLVRSQYDTLQPLQPDEYGVTISFDQSVTAIVDEFLAWWSRNPEPPTASAARS